MNSAAKKYSRAILISWLGRTDILASSGNDNSLGPLASAIEQLVFEQLILLNNYPLNEAKEYLQWLSSKFPGMSIDLRQIELSSPTCYSEIYQSALGVLEDICKKQLRSIITLHLSPGTPAMAAVWIILARTRFKARLIESSREHGVREVDFPFDLSAEFLPNSLRERDSRLSDLSASLPPVSPAFEDIACRSNVMQRVILKARKAALRNVPVLIEGESGTGKELLARAMHMAGPRKDQPFIAVNCGAIPHELLESELFGHVKGAFTGADRARTGYFEAAGGGTLFLDELGELPLPAQVKVLRAIQEKEIQRVGSTRSIPLDIRIISATNRDLLQEVKLGHFRQDLFYRLAVAVLKLPPLRQRPGDLSLLIDRLLEQVNAESMSEPDYVLKKLSPSARNILLTHSWPGNVRELMNTLLRAAIWSEQPSISQEDIKEAMLPSVENHDDGSILNRSLDQGLDLNELLGQVAGHYIQKALKETGGNKTKAAEMLGLKNYQTLDNWIEKYKVELDKSTRSA